MKAIIKSLGMVVLTAMAFTSCQKEQQKAASFTATTEQFANPSEEEAKVYLNGARQVVFENNDQVVLFNVDNETPANSQAALYKSASEGTSVTFDFVENMTNGFDDAVKDAFYAYYPSQGVSVNFGDRNVGTFTLATQQDYREMNNSPVLPKNCCYMAAKLTDVRSISNAHFVFQNICGILSLKFYSAAGRKIQSIEIEDPHFNLTGDVSLYLDEIDPTEMMAQFNNYAETDSYLTQLAAYEQRVGYSVKNAGHTVTLDCGTKVIGTTKAQPSQFFIVLRPLALMHGVNIRVNYIDANGNTGVKEVNSTKDLRISPSTFRNIAAVSID